VGDAVTFLFWFAVTFGTVYGMWNQSAWFRRTIWRIIDWWMVEPDDIDRLLDRQASRTAIRGDAGAGTGTSPRLATRPGIRGPLSNGRR
jgi:hypothetical protein